MIFNPTVSGGSSGGSWREITRKEAAELVGSNSWPFNVLVAIFTPDSPNQPMILPFSNLLSIGNAYIGRGAICTYCYAAPEEGLDKNIYVLTVNAAGMFSSDPEGNDIYFQLYLHDETGESDVIPEGWEIKLFVYEG